MYLKNTLTILQFHYTCCSYILSTITLVYLNVIKGKWLLFTPFPVTRSSLCIASYTQNNPAFRRFFRNFTFLLKLSSGNTYEC